MDGRPTKEVKTSGGHTVVLNEYITGGENWDIRSIYMRGLKPGGGDEGNVMLEAEKKAFELTIVSIDGQSEGISERVLALPLADYNEVAEEVKDIVDAKKKSQTSSGNTSRTGASGTNS